MTPSPALAAVFGDVLLCLGAGLMLGALRDAAGLALGDGRGRCFCWDVLTFILAAFVLCGFAAGASGSGVSRWYMAAGLGLGALAWRLGVSGALHRGLRRLLWVLCLPMRAVSHHVVAPLRHVLAARAVRRKNKSRKKPKKQKNMLQKERKILYN